MCNRRHHPKLQRFFSGDPGARLSEPQRVGRHDTLWVVLYRYRASMLRVKDPRFGPFAASPRCAVSELVTGSGNENRLPSSPDQSFLGRPSNGLD